MAIVVFNETSYECTRAVKGVDYIKLYDENNNIIVAFEGVSDFSEFILQEGVWEKGISTDTVSANAKLVSGVIQLDLTKPVSVETGLTVTFQAPCDYTDANDIMIESVSFSLVDALGVSIEAGVQAFVSGAMVAVILNCEDATAYIQNAAVSPHEHSISDVKNLQTTLNGKAPLSHTHDDRYYTETEINTKLSGKANSSHTHTKSQITDFPTSMPASDVYSWAKQSNKPSYTASEVGAAVTTTLKSSSVSASESSWSFGNDWYYQKVYCNGLLKNDIPIVDVSLNRDIDTAKLQIEAWSHIAVVEVQEDNYLTLYTDGTIPKVAFQINVKVVR